MRKLAGRSFGLRVRLLRQMVEAGVLVPRPERVLGFPLTRYALANVGLRDRLAGRVHDALVGESEPDAGLAALIGLLSACGLVDRTVSKEERKTAIRRAKEIASANPAAESVGQALREVEAGVMAAVIASIAASSVTSSGQGHWR